MCSTGVTVSVTFGKTKSNFHPRPKFTLTFGVLDDLSHDYVNPCMIEIYARL